MSSIHGQEDERLWSSHLPLENRSLSTTPKLGSKLDRDEPSDTLSILPALETSYDTTVPSTAMRGMLNCPCARKKSSRRHSASKAFQLILSSTVDRENVWANCRIEGSIEWGMWWSIECGVWFSSSLEPGERGCNSRCGVEGDSSGNDHGPRAWRVLWTGVVTLETMLRSVMQNTVSVMLCWRNHALTSPYEDGKVWEKGIVKCTHTCSVGLCLIDSRVW